MSFAIVLVMIVIFTRTFDDDGFSSKPNQQTILKYTDQMIVHKDVFTKDMYSAKEKMPWIDPILFEEARLKLRYGLFNKNELEKLFN
jgi:hypothetical protein